MMVSKQMSCNVGDLLPAWLAGTSIKKLYTQSLSETTLRGVAAYVSHHEVVSTRYTAQFRSRRRRVRGSSPVRQPPCRRCPRPSSALCSAQVQGPRH